jgi:glycosyltransferase involved in cell wall biosynthesis
MQVIRVGTRNTFNFFVPGALKTLLRQRSYDVLVDDINKIPFYTPFYTKIPVVAVLHHFFDRTIYRQAGFVPASYVYLAEKLVPIIYSKAPFTVVSKSTKEDLTRKGIPEANIRVIYNGIDHHTYAPDYSMKSKSPLVCYLGRLKKYKSVDLLIRAMVAVRREVPGVKLVVVGDGDHRPTLVKMVDELGLSDCVEFTGYVSAKEKVRLLQSAQLMVNPSPREGWGLTSVEANACGTPLVASDVPGLRDSCRDGETGYLFPFGDVDDMVSKMIKLLRDERLRLAFSENAVRWAREFDWNRSAQQMETFLRSVVS